MNFFSELKRRNVYKVAVAYAVVAWLVIQVAFTVLPTFHAAEWVLQTLVAVAVLGFPVALVLAWVFEVTPEGIKRAEDVLPNESSKHSTGRKLVAITIVLACVAGGLLAFQFLRSRTQSVVQGGAPATPDRQGLAGARPSIPDKSIAVLPFENLSDEKANAYFADGVQDEILTNLAKIADLKVISRTSVMQYKSGVARNLRKIGEELGVARVLEGSVQRAANKIRVNAQLIDARNDAHLWAQTYDRDLADVFAIQSEIAKAIADQLQAKLSPNERKAIERPPTTNVAAFDLYSRAKSILLTASFS
ncbi:MAG TPA: FlgO family outer membrane protein, partial [Chthoniobacterales bacterium]|nr:FlgO family outer membrane protein [Chthoniobacterales bacterium]